MADCPRVEKTVIEGSIIVIVLCSHTLFANVLPSQSKKKKKPKHQKQPLPQTHTKIQQKHHEKTVLTRLFSQSDVRQNFAENLLLSLPEH